MDFERRLEKAIHRGQRAGAEQDRRLAERELSEEQFRALHSQCRIDLSDHIEQCLKKLADHFPGFRFQTVIGDDGWGASIDRDDFDPERRSVFSRLRMVISPYGSAHIVELTARGTIRNRDVLNRRHFQFLKEADVDSFAELIDLWVLEYAEKFAAQAT